MNILAEEIDQLINAFDLQAWHSDFDTQSPCAGRRREQNTQSSPLISTYDICEAYSK